MTHVALVGDSNSQAYDRLKVENNFAAYPSLFYDGGYTVGVGGSLDSMFYRTRIEASGTRVVPNLDLIIRMKHISGTIYEINVKVGNGVDANRAPTIPSINGPTFSEKNVNNNYKVISTDLDADQLTYQFDYNDGNLSEWFGPYNSGDSCSLDRLWAQNGTYGFKVRTKDEWDVITDWSPLYSVQVGCCVTERGNVDGDISNIVDISDLVYLVDFMFTSGPAPSCLEEGNVDGDSSEIIDISDLVYLVDFMFTGGPVPPLCPF